MLAEDEVRSHGNVSASGMIRVSCRDSSEVSHAERPPALHSRTDVEVLAEMGT